MSAFTTHTTNSAPPAAQNLLQTAEKDFGFASNLLGVLAESPVTLDAYLKLDKLFGQCSFNKVERLIILLSISRFSDCCYCLAAHGTAAKKLQIPIAIAIINAIHYQQPLENIKFEALRNFTIAILENRGWIDKQDLQQFYQVGYRQQHVLEIILAISFKTIGNYVNHITDPEIDNPFIKGLPTTETC